jgi:hypothetical protein
MAWDIRSMIVFRAMEGLFGGSMIPVTQTAAVALFKGKGSARFPLPHPAPVWQAP